MLAAGAALYISIHAPHARSDFAPALHCGQNWPFQSTLLMRGATGSDVGLLERTREFQSTLLMRGATDNDLAVGRKIAFQSTLLMRGATQPHQPADVLARISIHAPHARSDLHRQVRYDHHARISIHAPHARSDRAADIMCHDTDDFNPRSSCEERRREYFQSSGL